MNQLYKNKEAQNDPKFKNNLEQPSLKIRQYLKNIELFQEHRALKLQTRDNKPRFSIVI